MSFNCSLQINLAPNDYLHAVNMLPRQLEIFSEQVDEMVLILDTHRSKGRFGEHWEENLANIRGLTQALSFRHKKVRMEEVDYSKDMRKHIADVFFEGGFIPEKDYRGGPFYAYFFGLYACKSDYVLHLDSDIFIGGLSRTWVREAIEHFENQSNLLICSPLPGPPHPQKILVGQPTAVGLEKDYHFLFKDMSTRVFMIDKRFFRQHKILLKRPAFTPLIKAVIKGNPPYCLPEHLISVYMKTYALDRIDFLGEGSGLWTLHPPYRTPQFYHLLPVIIKAVENNNLPPEQYGFYDIVNEVCDWTGIEEELFGKNWKKS